MQAAGRAVLLLEDGTSWEGFGIGAGGTSIGEICFNTGMTGYQEIFTDPSYFGQIVVATHTHIGNYGIHKLENQSEGIKIAGLVCKNFSEIFSRFDATETIQQWFVKQGVTGIQGVDTRALVRHIRSKGAMNGIISNEITDEKALTQQLKGHPSMAGLELASKVSTSKSYQYGNITARYKVAVLDLGIKQHILDSLAFRNCNMQVFPYNTPFSEMQRFEPDGFFISNGPGDPSVMTQSIETVKNMIGSNKPIFGICLGHQLLALANGISTYKMKYGHRGINHPVKNLITGRCEITSQNHGFCVDDVQTKNNNAIEITHINLNDKTIEGIKMKGKSVFSVQYHPESSPGPHDSRYLFDEFIGMMER